MNLYLETIQGTCDGEHISSINTKLSGTMLNTYTHMYTHTTHSHGASGLKGIKGNILKDDWHSRENTRSTANIIKLDNLTNCSS